MSLEYQYIHFVKIEEKTKTSVFSCRNNRSGDELGVVRWYAPWRTYCFFPHASTIFNIACFMDLVDFMSKANRREV